MAVYTIQLKRGKSTSWTSLDLILKPGEPGFEIDTGKLKIGDGETNVNLLPFITSARICILRRSIFLFCWFKETLYNSPTI